MMNKEVLEKYYNEKQQIILNLKNNRIYTCYVKEVRDSYVIVTDKFDNEIVIELSSISFIEPVMKKEGEDLND